MLGSVTFTLGIICVKETSTNYLENDWYKEQIILEKRKRVGTTDGGGT